MTDQRRLPESDALPDAPAGNWVDRAGSPTLRPFMRLSRFDRPIGAWLLLLPCWWGVMLAIAAAPTTARGEDIWICIACALGAILMRGAGCTWNDLTDRKIDGQVARTRSRPLPAGEVSPQAARIWMCAQAALSLLILLTFNVHAIMLGVLALIPVAIYPFAKRFTWWPQLFLGIAFNWGALLGWTAHTGALNAPAFLLYLGGIAWTLFYDTIYALQDRDDDELVGIKSTARLFQRRTKAWLGLFALLSAALLALATALAIPMTDPLSLTLATLGVLLFLAHLLNQLRTLDISRTTSCLIAFRSNRNAGLLLALMLALAAF